MSIHDNNRIQESSLEQIAEAREHLESIENLTAEMNEKLGKIAGLKIPEPSSNEETNKLLNNLIEEVKTPHNIIVKLNIK